jgi:hypothetical protein
MSVFRWKVGDFGRFESEDLGRPRFEVIGRKGDSIEVWYGGTARTTLIPRDTFLAECTNLWAWQRVHRPPWLKPGVVFVLHKRTHVLQAKIQVKPGKRWKQPHHVDVTGQDLRVRRIHHDHVSCLAGPLLVMVPVKQITDHGYRPLTALDRLVQDEGAFDEDDLSDIFG